jgi:hypothetical protein
MNFNINFGFATSTNSNSRRRPNNTSNRHHPYASPPTNQQSQQQQQRTTTRSNTQQPQQQQQQQQNPSTFEEFPGASFMDEQQRAFIRQHLQQHQQQHQEHHNRHQQQHQQFNTQHVPEHFIQNLFRTFGDHIQMDGLSLNDFISAFNNNNEDDGEDGFDFEDFLDQNFQQYQQQRQEAAPPTSQKAIDKFPTFEFTSEQEETMKANEFEMGCTICQSDFERDEVLISLPCQHTFHRDCILPWITSNNSCPNCRFELPLDDKELESERLQRMKARFTAEGLKIMEVGAEINGLQSTVHQIRLKYEDYLKKNPSPEKTYLESCNKSLGHIETQLENKLYVLDALEEFKEQRLKDQRKLQVVKIQSIQQLIQSLRKRLISSESEITTAQSS